MMGRHFAASLIALTLVGCADPGPPSDHQAEPQAQATGNAGHPAPDVTPAKEEQADRIPVRFLGTWDHAEEGCDPPSDLHLAIEEDKITFYEAVGRVTAVDEDEGSTTVTLAMAGEGERWEQTIGLRLFDAGTSLMVIDPDRPDEAEELMRKRCET